MSSCENPVIINHPISEDEESEISSAMRLAALESLGVEQNLPPQKLCFSNEIETYHIYSQSPVDAGRKQKLSRNLFVRHMSEDQILLDPYVTCEPFSKFYYQPPVNNDGAGKFISVGDREKCRNHVKDMYQSTGSFPHEFENEVTNRVREIRDKKGRFFELNFDWPLTTKDCMRAIPRSFRTRDMVNKAELELEHVLVHHEMICKQIGIENFEKYILKSSYEFIERAKTRSKCYDPRAISIEIFVEQCIRTIMLFTRHLKLLETVAANTNDFDAYRKTFALTSEFSISAIGLEDLGPTMCYHCSYEEEQMAMISSQVSEIKYTNAGHLKFLIDGVRK